MLVEETITIARAGADAAAWNADKRNKQETFKNCVPFTYCISEINNTQLDKSKELDIGMAMLNLIEYSGSYTKTSW